MSGPAPYWTRDRIVEAIQAWHRNTGTTPKVSDWRQATPFAPAHATVTKRFGSWNQAIEAAGFVGRTRRESWSRDTIADAARRWRDRNGRPPWADDWQFTGLDHPCYTTVYLYFGTWRQMLTHARMYPANRKRWTKQEIATAMLEWLLSTGSWPTYEDWSQGANGVERPSASTVVKMFGRWTAAKKFAGWDGSRPRKLAAACRLAVVEPSPAVSAPTAAVSLQSTSGGEADAPAAERRAA